MRIYRKPVIGLDLWICLQMIRRALQAMFTIWNHEFSIGIQGNKKLVAQSSAEAEYIAVVNQTI